MHAAAALSLVLIYIGPPALVAVLAMGRGPTRWAGYALAAVLLACWLPLLLVAPQLVRDVAALG